MCVRFVTRLSLKKPILKLTVYCILVRNRFIVTCVPCHFHAKAISKDICRYIKQANSINLYELGDNLLEDHTVSCYLAIFVCFVLQLMWWKCGNSY